MKRITALTICLLLMLSLTACGGESTPETTLAPETTAAPEPTAVPETTAAPETEAPTTEPQAAFDPHWAGEEFEMPIPQPPFTQFEVQDNGGMFLIQSTNPEEIAQLTGDDFTAYCTALIEAGFADVADQTSDEDRYGQPYHHFLASSEDNMGVELYFELGGGSMESEPSFVIVLALE